MTDEEVLVVPHDPAWQGAFATEATAISTALAENGVTVHHIGSTAIPGILAKPVIDLLAEVRDLGHVDEGSAAMVALGYEAMGEFGIAGRRYFRKRDADGVRTHHVHVFEAGSPGVERHLAFRDYLRANPAIARDYSDLKARLTGPSGRSSNDDYIAGKAAFMARTEEQALRWYRGAR